MNKLIFVSGGARSGKSSFSETLAKNINNYYFSDKNKIAYIATGVPFDDEFKLRIDKHKQERDLTFQTYEEPLKIDNQLNSIFDKHDVFIIECISTWLGNVYYKIREEEAYRYIEVTIDDILNILKKSDNYDKEKKYSDYVDSLFSNKKQKQKKFKILKDEKVVIIVSNETGLGIVPDNKLGRIFRDTIGFVNQKLSHLSDYSFFLINGTPLRLK
ncbi:MAG TPA: bifunctional adenosylcobinamide kinase/adenosylcobinamide-phosphate guanylyltransferase [Spirochaetota bacterium]|nr:bifunctional adenosylcobinamide kinase/adenosylcobinamide-phosphate guanylyltransferase [Spirochaetota bacterium]